MEQLKDRIAEEYCAGVPTYEGGILPAFGDALRAAAKPVAGTVCMILCLIFVSAVIKAASDALSPGNTAPDLCVALACSCTAFETLRRSAEAVRLGFEGVTVLMDTMSGAMCMMYGLTGNVAAGSSSVSVIMLALQIVRLISGRILLPLILACFGASLLSVFGFDAGLSGVCGAVKRAVTLLCAVSGAAVCALLTYQTVIAKAADTAAMRAVKFASSSFIPIIGSSLSESAAAVKTAIGAVRVSAGAGGAVSLALLTLPPALTVAASKLCMRLASFLCSVLGITSLGSFFDDCGSVLSVLLALTLTVSVVFTVACSLFCV